MGKLRQLSPELWPLNDVILFSYIELIFRGGVSCLPAALLFNSDIAITWSKTINIDEQYRSSRQDR